MREGGNLRSRREHRQTRGHPNGRVSPRWPGHSKGGSMSISGIRSAVTQWRVYIGLILVVGALVVVGHVLADEFNSQSGEQQSLKRVGHADLQFRAAYQPNVIVYP